MSRAAALLGAILALAAAAGVALAVGSRPANGEAAARAFHRLVGGLGCGPALDLSRCEAAFDPRLCPACSGDTGPVPGAAVFCPHHAGAVFDARLP